MKVHTMFVIGKRDIEAKAVRVHGKGNLGKPRSEAIAEILAMIREQCPVKRSVLAYTICVSASRNICLKKLDGALIPTTTFGIQAMKLGRHLTGVAISFA